MEKQIVEFNIQDIWPIALVFIIAGLGIAYGLQAMGEAKDDMITGAAGCNSTITTTCPAEFNATNSAISGVAKFPSKFGTIVTIVIAAIIIMILVRYLGASAN